MREKGRYYLLLIDYENKIDQSDGIFHNLLNRENLSDVMFMRLLNTYQIQN